MSRRPWVWREGFVCDECKTLQGAGVARQVAPGPPERLWCVACDPYEGSYDACLEPSAPRRALTSHKSK